MKISITVFVILCAINLFAPVDHPANQSEKNTPSPMISQDIMNIKEQESNDLGDEEDYMFYEQEIFSRKLFQKTLPPLTQEEKIIWSFRMSEPDLFL